jgi:phage protein D
VTGKTLTFRPAANHLGEVVALEYMRDLKWFNVRLSTVCQVSDVAVRGWNPATKQAIVSVARTDAETTRMKGTALGPELAEDAFGAFSAAVIDIPLASQAEADQIAQARFRDMAIELTSGEGEAVGNTALRAGTTVELLGLGARFTGAYYVVKAEHRAGPELGYITRFDVRRNAS